MTASSIQRLRTEIAGQVIAPVDAEYERARLVLLPQIDRRPAAIVRPVDADEVASVVGLAHERGFELAVRSGGHSAAGHGVSDGGIVLDLSRMKALEIDVGRAGRVGRDGPDRRRVDDRRRRRTASRPGSATPARSGSAASRSAAASATSCASIGLTIDDLLGAEIVTADGRLLHVDADHHPDLFWAIRGGGGNFGVVTRFRYRLHPVGDGHRRHARPACDRRRRRRVHRSGRSGAGGALDDRQRDDLRRRCRSCRRSGTASS